VVFYLGAVTEIIVLKQLPDIFTLCEGYAHVIKYF